MANIKKILIITPFFPPDKGGISNHVYNLNTNLIKQGFDITTIAPIRVRSKTLTPHNYSSQILRLNSIYLPGWPYPSLRSFSIPTDLGMKIKTIIRNGNFDIIHVHGHHYPISWCAINSAHKYGIPSILTMHGTYALNPNTTGGRSWIEDLVNNVWFSKIIPKNTGIIGLTKEITKYAKKLGKSKVKYFTIPNGVNTAIYKENIHRKKEYRQKYCISIDKHVILFCGRFEKVKGIIEFAKAVKNLIKNDKNIEVVIVGEGNLESDIRSILKDINGIHLLKWQPSNTIHELYILSDVFVIPSYFEGLPLTVIEAMNARLHIVYSNVGGIPEVLRGYTAKTVLQNISVEEIEKVLTTKFPEFEEDDSLNYAQKFDWRDIAIDTSKVYSECTEQNETSYN